MNSEGAHSHIQRLLTIRRFFLIVARLGICVAVVGCFILLSDSNVGEMRERDVVGILILIGVPIICIICTKRLLSQRPRMVLILRPFDSAIVSIGLRRLARRELVAMGNVITVADSQVRPATKTMNTARTLLSLGGVGTAWAIPVRMSAQTKADLEIIRSGLKPWRYAWMWLIAVRGMHALPASEQFWKDAIRALASQSDIICVDLSETGPGSVWEFELLTRYPVPAAVMLLSTSHRKREAEAVAKTFFGRTKGDLHLYSTEGLLINREAFINDLEEKCALLRLTAWGRADA